ncbi:MAG: hypothetical protein M3373_03090, partial [Gemmatimonadota bacterium]|nr:hypothetical protein [Gemmatimonadota bacterium]
MRTLLAAALAGAATGAVAGAVAPWAAASMRPAIVAANETVRGAPPMGMIASRTAHAAIDPFPFP